MNWLKKYKNSIFIALFSLVSLDTYSFELENIYFNQRMDGENGGYREFYLKNNYLAKQRYKVNVLPGTLNSGAKFIEIYPKVLTVEPKSKGVLKVFANAPKDEKPQVYDFKLQFQPIDIPTLAKSKEGRVTGASNVRIAPVIELKGYTGEVDFSKVLRLEKIKIEKSSTNKGIVLSGELSNNSYATIDFGAEAYGSNEFFYGSAYVGNIPGNTKDKIIQLSFPMIKEIDDLKKIKFYRTPSNTREVIKEIELKK